jgi:hypothetical protein
MRPTLGRRISLCVLVDRLCGRESIFLFSHTNEFCGKHKAAHERPLAGRGRRWARRVSEAGVAPALEKLQSPAGGAVAVGGEQGRQNSDSC